jgi:hypothetical protein
MRHTSCISQSLAHITPRIHHRSWDLGAWWHHHFDCILANGAHFRTTTISRCHVHTATNCSTYCIASGLKGFGRNAHVLHDWAHHVAHSFERGPHITAITHGTLKSLHTSG